MTTSLQEKMMNKIVEHTPPWVEKSVAREAEFDTLAELLEVPWLKARSSRPDFKEFCTNGNKLMAVYQHGRAWFIVGYLREPVRGLKKWGDDEMSDRGLRADVIIVDEQIPDGGEVQVQ